MNQEEPAVTEHTEKQHLMTLQDAAEVSGIPYNTLRNAIHAKHHRLEATLLNIGGYRVWHTTPEALRDYERMWRAAPWKRKL